MAQAHWQIAHAILDIVPGVMRAIALGLRRYDMFVSPTHLRTLLELAERPHNLSELAVKHDVSLPTMSNSITVLAERGWVSRERDPNDRRMLLIVLTPTGQSVLADVHQRARDLLLEHIASLSEQECQSLWEGLQILDRVFHQSI